MSAARSICFARSILWWRTNWCGLFPVDLRNVCEKCAVLNPTDSANSSRVTSASIFACTKSTTLRKRAGISPLPYEGGPN
jgi:hypothetical protein